MTSAKRPQGVYDTPAWLVQEHPAHVREYVRWWLDRCSQSRTQARRKLLSATWQPVPVRRYSEGPHYRGPYLANSEVSGCRLGQVENQRPAAHIPPISGLRALVFRSVYGVVAEAASVTHVAKGPTGWGPFLLPSYTCPATDRPLQRCAVVTLGRAVIGATRVGVLPGKDPRIGGT